MDSGGGACRAESIAAASFTAPDSTVGLAAGTGAFSNLRKASSVFACVVTLGSVTFAAVANCFHWSPFISAALSAGMPCSLSSAAIAFVIGAGAPQILKGLALRFSNNARGQVVADDQGADK